jgi:hypothetical protein
MSDTDLIPMPDRFTVTRYGPGTQPRSWQPGDFLLLHGEGLLSRLIRTAQRAALRGDDRRYADWSHTALVVSGDGDLVEAIGGQGVIRSNASRYRDNEYRLVRITADDDARERAVQFATWVADNQPSYGWLTIVSIALLHSTRGHLTIQLAGQEICSGLVAGALERSGVLVTPTPSHVTPADLARAFTVDAPHRAPALLR